MARHVLTGETNRKMTIKVSELKLYYVLCCPFTIFILKQSFTYVGSFAGSELCLRAVCLEKCGVAEQQSLHNDSSVNQRHSSLFAACTGDDYFFSLPLLWGNPPLHLHQQHRCPLLLPSCVCSSYTCGHLHPHHANQTQVCG